MVRDLIRKLFYDDRLSFKTLETAILTDERLMDNQRRRAMNRLSFCPAVAVRRPALHG